MAFKMKGSPFQRNFGIGSPMKQDEEYKPQSLMTQEELDVLAYGESQPVPDSKKKTGGQADGPDLSDSQKKTFQKAGGSGSVVSNVEETEKEKEKRLLDAELDEGREKMEREEYLKNQAYWAAKDKMKKKKKWWQR